MIRFLLVFLAGLLLGANVVYFAMHRTAPGAAPSATTSSAMPSTPAILAPDEAIPAQAENTLPPARPTQTIAPPVVSGTSTEPSGLLLPVAGVHAGQLVDTYSDARGDGRVHDAIDIMAPRGTPVLAASDGSVAKLFTSKAGGLTIYEFDPASTWVYYYAHLDRYAAGLAEGQALHRGDVIGYVGSSGNASPDAPHLHFEVSRLGPEKHWWQASPLNPYPLLGGKPH